MSTEIKKQNLYIIIAIALCVLHIAIMKLTEADLLNILNWVMALAVTYLAIVAYGIFSLVRIITTQQKRTLRYCMPFIIIAVVLLLLNFGKMVTSQLSISA